MKEKLSSTTGETSSKMPLVELKDIELIYHNTKKPALSQVSLTIYPGERVCLLGANGSGKSTLSKVIGGIMAPDSGIVSYEGRVAYSQDKGVDSEAYRSAREHIAYVFQDPEDQIVARIVEEDVAFGPENKALPTHQIRSLVDTCLETVAMSEYAQTDISELSGGQQQRVAIASALAMEPTLFIADEPASMLDIRGRRAALKLLGDLQEKSCAIVHITHYVEEAQYADKIVLMEEGKVAFIGTYAQLLEQPELLTHQNLELPFELKLKRELQVRKGVAGQDRAIAENVHLALQKSQGHEPTQIEVRDLTFTYNKADHALSHLNLSVKKGEYVCLIGQTGSGKTTLARTLAGLNTDFSGSVEVLGTSLKSRKMCSKLQGKIGYIMQKPERQLFAETVEEDVAYGPTCQGLTPDDVRARTEDALNLLGISHLAGKSPFELSGGQQRLVAIAGILSMNPEILILDEPCASLDSAASAKLLGILKELNARGLTCIMVTHSMEDAASMSDTIYVLSKGKIVAEGSPEEVFAQETLLKDIGLGIPQPKAYARALNERLGLDLAEALTFDELVDELSSKEVDYELV